jgi:hypothetical protein
MIASATLSGSFLMFTFMNTARIGTAVQGIAHAELSFQGALPYAKDLSKLSTAVADARIPILCSIEPQATVLRSPTPPSK